VCVCRYEMGRQKVLSFVVVEFPKFTRELLAHFLCSYENMVGDKLVLC